MATPVRNEPGKTQFAGHEARMASSATSSVTEKDKPDVEAPAEAPMPAAPAGPNPADFPDGGLKAWSVVVGSWCLMFVSMGWINCIGVFQTYYQTHQLSSYTPSTVAWITATETFMMFAGSPMFGKIFDNFGSRPLVLFGVFFHCFGLMMTSISHEYYQIFLSQAVVSGLGASAIFYGALNPVGTWFFKKRALVFGIIAAGSSLAGLILPIMIERLFDQIGFGWTMRVCAFMFLGLGLIGLATCHSRLPPRKTPLHINEFIEPFSEVPFLLNSLASFFFFWGAFAPTNFIILEAQHYGMSDYLSGYLLAILNAGSIIGRVLPGYIGDKLGRFNVMIVTTAVTVVFVLGMWIPAKTNASIIAFSAIYGFTSGTFVSMVPALVAQISKDVRKIGVRNGSNFFVISLAALTGNPIAGALITRDNGGYLYLQIFCGITMAVGCALFIAARTVLLGGLKPGKV